MWSLVSAEFGRVNCGLVGQRIQQSCRQLKRSVSKVRQNKPRSEFASESRRSLREHPYNKLYPWTSLNQFVDYLCDNICYNDGGLIAIDKPWGVGIHKSELVITKQTAYHMIGVAATSCKYHVAETLEKLSEKLNLNKSLKLIKTIDRHKSGIILLGCREESVQLAVKAINRAKSHNLTYAKYLCITKGWPVIADSQLNERVGIKLIEIDELGDYKEPVIVNSDKLTRNMRRGNPLKDGMRVLTSRVEVKVLDINKELGTALVEVGLNKQQHDFLSCYLSFKASFILGDNRFSRRVQDILGVSISHTPTKLVNLNFSNDYEPLPKHIASRLLINKNCDIPLMAHLRTVYLKNYWPRNNLIIKTKRLPPHFEWTLKNLDLKLPIEEENDSQQQRDYLIQ